MFNILQPFFSPPPILKIFVLFLSPCVFREAFCGMVSRRMRGQRKTERDAQVSSVIGDGLELQVPRMRARPSLLRVSHQHWPTNCPPFHPWTPARVHLLHFIPIPPSVLEDLWLIRGGLRKAEECSGTRFIQRIHGKVREYKERYEKEEVMGVFSGETLWLSIG